MAAQGQQDALHKYMHLIARSPHDGTQQKQLPQKATMHVRSSHWVNLQRGQCISAAGLRTGLEAAKACWNDEDEMKTN